MINNDSADKEFVEKEECADGENINNEITISNTKASFKEFVQKISNELMKFSTRKAIKRTVLNILSTILFCFCAILLIICSSNLYQNIFNPDGHTGFFGIGEAVVVSNSMDSPDSKPRIKINDLVFYRTVNLGEIAEGDIIVYEKENTNGDSTLVIHRVVDITENDFIAKGDNNKSNDIQMPTSSIVGKYMFKINRIGTLFRLISSAGASITIFIVFIIIFVLRIFIYLWHKKALIKKISINEDTRSAVDYFFDL